MTRCEDSWALEGYKRGRVDSRVDTAAVVLFVVLCAAVVLVSYLFLDVSFFSFILLRHIKTYFSAF